MNGLRKEYEWLDGFLLGMTGAEKEFKEEWGATLYKVGGKFFALLGGDKAGRGLISFKLEPEMGEELRREFAGLIVPGYYLNKTHWNSVYLDGADGDVPEETIKMMAEESYRLIFAGLSKKMQGEIREEENEV